MSELETAIEAGSGRLFAELAARERDPVASISAASLTTAWAPLNEQGYLLALAREAHGGIEASWEEIWPLLYGIGTHQLSLPLADTLIAVGVLSAHGIDPRPLLSQPIALGCVRHQSAAMPVQVHAGPDAQHTVLSGVLERVGWASQAGHLLLEDTSSRLHLVPLDCAQVFIEPSTDMAGQPADLIRLDGASALALPGANLRPGEALLLLGAASRAIMMAGALDSVLEQSLQHANERQQFGRPIGRNQALQFQLAHLAGECAAARTVARAAAINMGRMVEGHGLSPQAASAIAVAKQIAGEAASVAAAVGHQVHGAIGFTREHRLQAATRRLWVWRGEFGAESWWAMRLGRAAIEAGAEALWPRLTASSLL